MLLLICIHNNYISPIAIPISNTITIAVQRQLLLEVNKQITVPYSLLYTPTTTCDTSIVLVLLLLLSILFMVLVVNHYQWYTVIVL